MSEPIEGEIVDGGASDDTTQGTQDIVRSAVSRNGGTAKYDWEYVKDVYVQGYVHPETGKREWHANMRELAEATGVPYKKLRERKAKGQWDQDKAQFQVQTKKIETDQRAAHMVSEIVDFDAKALAGAKVGVMLIQARMGEISEQLRYHRDLVRGGFTSETQSKDSTWLDAGELAQLSRSLTVFQEVGRKALVDAIDHDLVGGNATALDPSVIDVREELAYSDDERLAKTFDSLAQAGLFDAVSAAESAEEAEQGSDEE